MKLRIAVLLFIFSAIFLCIDHSVESYAEDSFLIGSGVYDITGPAAERGMMGYGMLDQKTTGIHTRLRARAFVVADPRNGKRVAFVSSDLCMVTQAVKQKVLEKLRATYGSLYSDQN